MQISTLMINANTKQLWLLFILTIGMSIVLQIQGSDLKTPAAPNGIIGLELSFTQEKASAIAQEWKNDLKKVFHINMILDYLYILIYGAFFFFSCRYFASRRTIPSSRGNYIAIAVLLAMLFDCLENVLMIVSINDAPNNTITLLTACFAILKFSIIIIAIFYILYSLLTLSKNK